MMKNKYSTYLVALITTLNNEGGEADLKGDPGKYTVLGISSARHPECEIWGYIAQNEGLAKKEIKDIISSITQWKEPSGNMMWNLVKKFFYEEFWTPGRLNDVAAISPDIALEVFDTSVLMGYGNEDKPGAGVFLQETINLLNRAERLYPNIKVDGAIGPNTLKGLEECTRHNDEGMVLGLLNNLQAERSIQLMRNKESFEEFPGWFNRTKVKRNVLVLNLLDSIYEATAAARSALM